MRTCKKVSDAAASASAAAATAAAAASPSRRHSGSHSRAERARRQRIKQRMQHLQNLVPGCKNMTGRAALDKIISYVVSLQHQIEVLSIMLSQASQEAIDAERVRVSEVENPEMWLPVSDSLMGSSVSPSSAFYI